MTKAKCSDCGQDWDEHRFMGELIIHPGLASTWVWHERLVKTLSEQDKKDLLRRRRRERAGLNEA